MADERRRTFLRKVYELARSGHFEGEQALEAALQKDYPEAKEWLSNPFIREGLRQVRDLARAERREEKGRSEA